MNDISVTTDAGVALIKDLLAHGFTKSKLASILGIARQNFKRIADGIQGLLRNQALHLMDLNLAFDELHYQVDLTRPVYVCFRDENGELSPLDGSYLHPDKAIMIQMLIDDSDQYYSLAAIEALEEPNQLVFKN